MAEATKILYINTSEIIQEKLTKSGVNTTPDKSESGINVKK